jgi:hypothetical protein
MSLPLIFLPVDEGRRVRRNQYPLRNSEPLTGLHNALIDALNHAERARARYPLDASLEASIRFALSACRTVRRSR